MLMCTRCNEVYRPGSIVPEHIAGTSIMRCPRRACSSKVVEVDDIILPTILTLNMKGYKPFSCCSGHIIGPGERELNSVYIYIKFAKKVELDISNIPDGFKYDPETKMLNSRTYIESIYDKQAHIFAENLKLLKWAESLEDKTLVEYEKNLKLFKESTNT